eukprot:763482-Hanusia_phi.AAC.11
MEFDEKAKQPIQDVGDTPRNSAACSRTVEDSLAKDLLLQIQALQSHLTSCNSILSRRRGHGGDNGDKYL